MRERPKRDPRVRPDGRCARRGCDKQVKILANPQAKGVYRDPFCSTVCCKLYWGVMTDEEAESYTLRSEVGKKNGLNKHTRGNRKK